MVGCDTRWFSPLCAKRQRIPGKPWLYRGRSQVRQALDPSVRCFSGGTFKLVPPWKALALALRPKVDRKCLQALHDANSKAAPRNRQEPAAWSYILLRGRAGLN